MRSDGNALLKVMVIEQNTAIKAPRIELVSTKQRQALHATLGDEWEEF